MGHAPGGPARGGVDEVDKVHRLDRGMRSFQLQVRILGPRSVSTHATERSPRPTKPPKPDTSAKHYRRATRGGGCRTTSQLKRVPCGNYMLGKAQQPTLSANICSSALRRADSLVSLHTVR